MATKAEKKADRERKQRTGNNAQNALTPLQTRFLALRKDGYTPASAYLLAGGSKKNVLSGPYNLERKIREYGITREDMLLRGRAASEKILDDFLEDNAAAHVPAVTTIIKMQQDRLDPAVQKTEAKSLHLHLVSPEIRAAVNDTFDEMMVKASDWTKKPTQIIDMKEVAE